MPLGNTSSKTIRYGISVASVLVALTVRLGLDPVLGSTEEFLVLLAGVFVAARYGGRGPGLLATALAVLAAEFFFVDPQYSFAITHLRDIGSMLLLAATGVAISLLSIHPREVVLREFEEPRSWWNASFFHRIALLGGAFVLLAILTRLLYTDFEREEVQRYWVAHTNQVLNTVGNLISQLEHAETAQRGYLLTGDESYIGPFQAALEGTKSALASLRHLTADNPSQKVRLDVLERLGEARSAVLQENFEVRRSSGLDAAIARVRRGGGERIMNEFRANLFAVEEAERRLLEARSAAVEAMALRTRWVLGMGSGSLLVLLAIAGVTIERDIRDRDRAQQMQRTSEQRLRMALDAADAGAWEWNLQTNQDVWSEELWKVYGLEPHSCEPSYEAWRRILHPDDRKRAEQAVTEAARAGGDLNVEFRVCDRNGAQRWLLARAQPLRDAAGRAIRYIGIVLDITRRKQAEEALREREEILRRFTDVAPVAIAMFDREMRYLAASQRFRDDYHLGTQQLLGRSHYEIFPEIDEHWRQVHRRCLAGATEHHPGERFERLDGAEHWVRWEIQPWRQAAGQIGGIVLFSEDITGQRRSAQALEESEASLRLLNAELEQRVCQRTLELENANRELEAFAYSVSHDLRAPLRGIDGWSLALAEDYAGQLEGRAREYLDRVRSETQHMGLLIDDMLQLSGVTRSGMQLAPVSLTRIAQNIAAGLKQAEAGRRFDFVVEPELTAMGDARLLEIALTNLLANAVKFTALREVAKIEIGATTHEGNRVFFVRDNGVGFDMAYAGALFRPFQRLHKNSEFSGTGIGLAIVQRVIHRHGGRVWTKAMPARGATFYFTLGAHENQQSDPLD
ncbi:MAG: CHASE3 domain-containing protein [Bryobacteraceae bacterium]|jgi:PAS domain S-box-containing protein